MAAATGPSLSLSFSSSTSKPQLCGLVYASALYHKLTSPLNRPSGSDWEKQIQERKRDDDLKNAIYEKTIQIRPKDSIRALRDRGVLGKGEFGKLYGLAYGFSSIYNLGTCEFDREPLQRHPGFQKLLSGLPKGLHRDGLIRIIRILRNRLEMMEIADRYVRYLGLQLPGGNKCRWWNLAKYEQCKYPDEASQEELDTILRGYYLFPKIPKQAGGEEFTFQKPEKYLRAAIFNSKRSPEQILLGLRDLVKVVEMELEETSVWLMTINKM